MVATTHDKSFLKTAILAVAILAGIGVAAGVATAPGATLDALVERSGAGTLYPPLLPVGVATRTVLAMCAGALVAALGAGVSLAPMLATWRARMKPKTKAEGDGAAQGTPLAPPSVRRADAHPDAPPRRPIRASSDLGAPLPIAGEEQAAPAAAPRPIAEPPSVPAIVTGASQALTPAGVPATQTEASLPDDLDLPLAAFDPGALPAEPLEPLRVLPPLARIEPAGEAQPAPEMAAESESPAQGEMDEPQRESIGDLLARLERGRLGRRHDSAPVPAAPSAPVAPPVAPVPAQSLDETLERLRRLAAG